MDDLLQDVNKINLWRIWYRVEKVLPGKTACNIRRSLRRRRAAEKRIAIRWTAYFTTMLQSRLCFAPYYGFRTCENCCIQLADCRMMLRLGKDLDTVWEPLTKVLTMKEVQVGHLLKYSIKQALVIYCWIVNKTITKQFGSLAFFRFS